jgi:hypothetical protein|tara:strand:- start:504 stop:734 length:231 start_codon:yes stop_codon:yes gene_type:complete
MNPFKLTPSKISQSVESNLSTNIEFAIINIGTELGVDVYETKFINKVGKDIQTLKNNLIKEIIKQCHHEYNIRKRF